jgi:hypothetical protein
MVGGRPTVDLPRAVRARIEARTGDAAFVVPDFRTSLGTTPADLCSPEHGHPRDVPLRDVWPEARFDRGLGDGGWLLISVEDESGQRP